MIETLFKAAVDAYDLHGTSLNLADVSERWGAAIKVIESSHDSVTILECDEWVIVAVAGSDDIQDWWSNFRVSVTEKGPCGLPTHTGFTEAFTDLNESVDAELHRIMGTDVRQEGICQSPRVFFTGHSRGGAIAQCLALHAFTHRTAALQCVTFGSPRVFAKRATVPAKFTRNLTRVENSNDIVTHGPTSWRFRHVGSRLLITDSGDRLLNPSLWKLLWVKLRSYNHDAASDHMLESYREALAASAPVS